MKEFLYSRAVQSLYIHWPFCPYKCHFCDFVAIASHDEYMGQYHEALLREIKEFIQITDRSVEVKTLYLGGGTPSTYPPQLLLDTFDTLRSGVTFSSQAEITIEVNPGTLTESALAVWKEVGINRVSMGVQSLNDNVLKKLNRHQSSRDVENALEQMGNAFEVVSIDLILGLPGVSAEEWKEMIKKIVFWPISHISVYFLMVQENTPLFFGVQSKKITLPCDDELVDLYWWTIEYLAVYGFDQYEISNFARNGKFSRHNKVYWDRVPFKGFGLGACSFDGQARFQNNKNLMAYMQLISEGKSITIFAEDLSREQIVLEKIMLGLRQINGIKMEHFCSWLTDAEKEKKLSILKKLADQKLIKQEEESIRLTPRGLALENEIIAQLSI